MLSFILACIHLDPLAILRAGGYVGLALLIFAESGLLFGIFLPGDSLLFAAGLLTIDVLALRIVSGVFDRERLVTGAKAARLH